MTGHKHVCNATAIHERLTEVGLYSEHGITFHRLILWIAGACAVFATLVSLSLMTMHALRYSKPSEQRHIIRILFMVPIFSMVSWLSIFFYYHATDYEVVRDCYEAIVIASFFSLMSGYVAPDLKAQKQYFRSIKPKPWLPPVSWLAKIPGCGGDRGCLRTPRSGLTWFNVVWVGVFQYCFFRVATTLIATISNHWNKYCPGSLSPAFSHIWVIIIQIISVTITMTCLIQFYWQIKDDIKQYKPVMKVVSIKLVIFLSFWQGILITILTSSGAIKPSKKVQTPDIKVGFAGMLFCCEMAVFSVLHVWSFSYKPYVIGHPEWQAIRDASKMGSSDPEVTDRYHGGPLGLRALIEVVNPWDLIKAVGRSARWLFQGRRHRHEDSSYNDAYSDTQKLDDVEVSFTYVSPNKNQDNRK